MNYRATYEQLKPEIHYYNFNVGPYGLAGVDKVSLFISRIEAILDKEHQGWPLAKKIHEDQNLANNSASSQLFKVLTQNLFIIHFTNCV